MIIHGDCLAVMPTLDAESIDSIVTDPPYGLSFMDKEWDHGVPGVPFWIEALRVAKPGAHLLAFGGTRTYHRLAAAIEDAGWEIRDCIMWVYGEGFPKSLDVSKAIDKAAGAKREVVGIANGAGSQNTESLGEYEPIYDVTVPATDSAKTWDGWGTALKPAVEPIVVARKPFQGTVAANVLKHGTGAINVDGCRVGDEERPEMRSTGEILGGNAAMNGPNTGRVHTGRWPANLIHDGSPEVVALFPQTTTGTYTITMDHAAMGYRGGEGSERHVEGDSGSAARFFYCPKADRERFNRHPTVKPVDLMRYLIRLVTRRGGTVLDPFLGSGTTGVAADAEGCEWVGIERDPESVATARRRTEAKQGLLS